MDKADFFHALTLWFVTLTFIQTASGSSTNGILNAIGLFALALTYLVPLYILIGLGTNLATN